MNKNIVDLVYDIQPLINKRKRSIDEEIKLTILMLKYSNNGGDIEYFTSGSGAPGNCIIL